MEFIPYKINETINYLYYQIPMELFFNKYYSDNLSLEAKVLYGLILSQLTLSLKNNWQDENGDVYVNSEQELLDYQKSAYEKINPLKSERENLWRKHKRAKTKDEKTIIENQIIEISKKITPLAEKIKHL